MKFNQVVFTFTLFVLLCFAAGPLVAQGQSGNKDKKEKKEKTEKVEKAKEPKSEVDDDDMGELEADKPEKQKKEKSEKGKDESNKSKGNAYGKEKGDASGKEFGQARAEAAKSRNTDRKAEVQQEITEKKALAKDAATKIERARQELATAKSSGKMSPEEIKKREAAIEKASKRLLELEVGVNKMEQSIKKESGGNN